MCDFPLFLLAHGPGGRTRRRRGRGPGDCRSGARFLALRDDHRRCPGRGRRSPRVASARPGPRRDHAPREAGFDEGRPVKAVIMAGGEGTRLRPLTTEPAQADVAAANRPMSEHVISLLKRHGFTDIVITVAFLAEHDPQLLRRRLRSWRADRYATEESPLGTAGSVRTPAPVGRALSRDFGRRAHRHRSHRARRFPRDKGRARHRSCLKRDRESARVRHRHHRRRRDASSDSSRSRRGARSSPTPSTPASTCSSRWCFDHVARAAPSISPQRSFPSCSSRRAAAVRLRLRPVLGGRRHARRPISTRTTTSSTARSQSSSTPSRCVTASGSARAPRSTRRQRSTAPALIGDNCRIGPGARVGAYTVLGANVHVGEGADARTQRRARQLLHRPGDRDVAVPSSALLRTAAGGEPRRGGRHR